MKRWIGSAAAVVVAATCGVWAAEPAPASQKEKTAEQGKAIVGKWRMAVLRYDGKDIPKDANPECEVTFHADRTVVIQQFKRADGALLFEGSGTYQLDLAASPLIRVVWKLPPGEEPDRGPEWLPFEVRENGNTLSVSQFDPVDELEAALADESAPLPPVHLHEMVFNRVAAE